MGKPPVARMIQYRLPPTLLMQLQQSLDDQVIPMLESLLEAHGGSVVIPDGEYTVEKGKIYPHVCANCMHDYSERFPVYTFICECGHHEEGVKEFTDCREIDCEDYSFCAEVALK